LFFLVAGRVPLHPAYRSTIGSDSFIDRETPSVDSSNRPPDWSRTGRQLTERKRQRRQTRRTLGTEPLRGGPHGAAAERRCTRKAPSQCSVDQQPTSLSLSSL
jgi:hypothetical protein